MSKRFLRRNCPPDARIGSYRDVQEARARGAMDLDAFNYVSLPAWDAGLLPDGRFRLALNIWSMQEMSRHHEQLCYDL